MKKRPWLAHLKTDKEECQPAEELKGSTSGTISSFKTSWDQYYKTYFSQPVAPYIKPRFQCGIYN